MIFYSMIIVTCAINLMWTLWLIKRSEEMERIREEILVEKRKLVNEIEHMIDEVKSLK